MGKEDFDEMGVINYGDTNITFLFRLTHDSEVIEDIESVKSYIEIKQINRITDMSDNKKRFFSKGFVFPSGKSYQ